MKVKLQVRSFLLKSILWTCKKIGFVFTVLSITELDLDLMICASVHEFRLKYFNDSLSKNNSPKSNNPLAGLRDKKL